MILSSSPSAGSLYFSSNVPDIVVHRENAGEIEFVFKVLRNSAIIVQETYQYDIEGKVVIRRLSDVVSSFFADGLIQTFDFIVGEITLSGVMVLKCDSIVSVTSADVWTKANFLTRAGQRKRTAYGRQEFLSYAHLPSYGTLTKNARIVTASGSTIVSLGTLAGVGAADVKTFDASLATVLAGTGILAAAVYRYEIWLSGTGYTTNTYKFLPDNNPYRYKTNLIFENAFGCPETFTATGTMSVVKNVEKTFGNIQNNYRKLTQDFVSEKSKNSGHLIYTEMSWLDDLIRSFNIYTYAIDGVGVNEEVTIVNSDKTDTDANLLQSFRFNYRKSKIQHLHFATALDGVFDYTFDDSFE